MFKRLCLRKNLQKPFQSVEKIFPAISYSILFEVLVGPSYTLKISSKLIPHNTYSEDRRQFTVALNIELPRLSCNALRRSKSRKSLGRRTKNRPSSLLKSRGREELKIPTSKTRKRNRSPFHLSRKKRPPNRRWNPTRRLWTNIMHSSPLPFTRQTPNFEL